MIFQTIKVVFKLVAEPRHYRKTWYQSGVGFWGIFGVAIVFTLVGVISIILAVLRMLGLLPGFLDIIGLSYWGYWMLVPAFFIWLGGIQNYIRASRIRREVLAAALNYEGKKIPLATLCGELGRTQVEVMRVLVDLRTKGDLRYRYDTGSGELEIGEELPADYHKPAEPVKDKPFCPHCGNPVTQNFNFCISCGSELK